MPSAIHGALVDRLFLVAATVLASSRASSAPTHFTLAQGQGPLQHRLTFSCTCDLSYIFIIVAPHVVPCSLTISASVAMTARHHQVTIPTPVLRGHFCFWISAYRPSSSSFFFFDFVLLLLVSYKPNNLHVLLSIIDNQNIWGSLHAHQDFTSCTPCFWCATIHTPRLLGYAICEHQICWCEHMCTPLKLVYRSMHTKIVNNLVCMDLYTNFNGVHKRHTPKCTQDHQVCTPSPEKCWCAMTSTPKPWLFWCAFWCAAK
jgi:hypothetical protein